MKEIAGLLKGAEREERVLAKPNRTGGAAENRVKEMEKRFYFPILCVNVLKLLSKWGTDKFF